MKRFGFLLLVLALVHCGSAPSTGHESGRSGSTAAVMAASGQSGPAAASRPRSSAKTIRLEGSPSLGSEDASVVVALWSDFQ